MKGANEMSSKGHNIVNGVAKQLVRKHNVERLGRTYVLTVDGATNYVFRSGNVWVAKHHDADGEWIHTLTAKTLGEAIENLVGKEVA